MSDILQLPWHPDVVEIKHILLPPSRSEFKVIYVVFKLMESSPTNVFHRDLKPKNILANADCKLKICNFEILRVSFNDTPLAILWNFDENSCIIYVEEEAAGTRPLIYGRTCILQVPFDGYLCLLKLNYEIHLVVFRTAILLCTHKLFSVVDITKKEMQSIIIDRGYPETNGRGLDPRRFRPFPDDENDYFETIRTDVPPSNEPSIPQSNIHLSNEPVLTNVPHSNELFQTIPTNVPLSNEPFIPQSSIHLSNEPVLTNIPPSNKTTLANVPLSIEPEPIIGQSKTSDSETTESWTYFLEMFGYNFHGYDTRFVIILYRNPRIINVVPKIRNRLRNHVESWNNVILKVRDLHIHVFIEELRRICSEMSYTYREEAEKSQVRLTP
ncbi:hypothetical protein GIB67_009383 [Kingdonia uniflora]|uniref:Protein kinase domain-containing protein n=1 Tax=Kingdonia uniflora TaxID=39325 RepID=A0A7J7N372_9MAGN|nr:hypothetical protein GIB67_009383 [Kingdonia uniflora]